jgi:hypothetical protein
LPKRILDRGFDFDGTRVPLMSSQGIFKPRIFDLPLSFMTAPPNMRKPRPYEDELGVDGIIRYCGTDPNHRDNVGMERGPGALTFTIQVDDNREITPMVGVIEYKARRDPSLHDSGDLAMTSPT